MLRTSNSKYLSQTSLFVQTPQGCSLPRFRRRYQYRNAEIRVGVVDGRHIWVVKQAAVLTSFFFTCRLFMLTYTACAVLNSKLQCPVVLRRITDFSFGGVSKNILHMYICTSAPCDQAPSNKLISQLYREAHNHLLYTGEYI